MAVQAGIRMIQSGAHRCVLVAGVEKQSDTTTTADSMLSYVDADFEAPAGFDFVDTMALMHARYLQVHGVPEDAVAAFAVADRWYARRNPVAVDAGRPELTTADVLGSGWVSKPITRAACGRACDGSSAVVLVAAEDAPGAPVIAGIAQATGPNGLAAKFGFPGYDGDIVRALPTALAAESAYRQAGIDAQDIDVAQVHDCFSIMGSLHLEALGVFPAGKAALAVRAGETALDGRCPVNTDGGRIGLGHPTGTTGINVVVESVRQLRREAGERQVRDPEVAVCQSMGGNNATSAVAVLRREPGGA